MSTAYALKGDVLDQLQKLQETVPHAAEPDRDITEVKVEDHSEANAAEARMMLIYTLLGVLGIGLAGAGTEYISFRLQTTRKEY